MRVRFYNCDRIKAERIRRVAKNHACNFPKNPILTRFRKPVAIGSNWHRSISISIDRTQKYDRSIRAAHVIPNASARQCSLHARLHAFHIFCGMQLYRDCVCNEIFNKDSKKNSRWNLFLLSRVKIYLNTFSNYNQKKSKFLKVFY